MARGAIRVGGQNAFAHFLCFGEGGLGIRHPIRTRQLIVAMTHRRHDDFVIRLQLQRLLVQLPRLEHSFLGELEEFVHGARRELPRFEVLGTALPELRVVAHHQLGLQGHDDVAGDLVLHLENVLDLSVVTFGPEMAGVGGIDQLRGDAHPVAAAPDTAFEHELHAEFGGDILHADGFTFVRKRRVPRDDGEAWNFRQRGDDVFGDAIGKVFLLGVARHVGERQHGDRRLVGKRRRILRARLRGPAGRAALGPVVDANRLGDVLEFVLAAIFEADVDFCLRVLVRGGAKGDAAGRGDLL